ncbi:MAG: hypothetical protein D5R98_10530 [Desulfonatronovibrio sp. MSAO_Bac4]|nr:MAG: hypothetical protein D5R98_10530 [Desulfonatronovibrio sp. MSAO_Bac4]
MFNRAGKGRKGRKKFFHLPGNPVKPVCDGDYVCLTRQAANEKAAFLKADVRFSKISSLLSLTLRPSHLCGSDVFVFLAGFQ